MNHDICAVFVCNKAYFNKFIYTCSQLVTNGKYYGNICLVIGDDLHNDDLLTCDFIKNNNIIIKHFPNIQFPDTFINIQYKLNRNPQLFEKIFQYHKMYLFETFFKQWNYIFYLDCGITIFTDILPLLNEVADNTLLAHSDAYPSYQWKLKDQFDKTNEEYFSKLNSRYNLEVDYFQTTIMLYDTKIIKEDTYNNIFNLLLEYPISITNEQGIIALYFTNIERLFTQIKTHNQYTYFYDYLARNNTNNYIMLKSI